MTIQAIELTIEEIERYAPYHTMPGFSAGFNSYNRGDRWPGVTTHITDGIYAQAYDRGAECAMRRQRAAGR